MNIINRPGKFPETVALIMFSYVIPYFIVSGLRRRKNENEVGYLYLIVHVFTLNTRVIVADPPYWIC